MTNRVVMPIQQKCKHEARGNLYKGSLIQCYCVALAKSAGSCRAVFIDVFQDICPLKSLEKIKSEKPPAFEINGQPIRGDLWQDVINFCHGDKLMAGRVFYRAYFKRAEKIEAWVRGGMADKKNAYILRPVQPETDAPQAVKRWIEETCWKMGPQSIKSQIQKEIINATKNNA